MTTAGIFFSPEFHSTLEDFFSLVDVPLPPFLCRSLLDLRKEVHKITQNLENKRVELILAHGEENPQGTVQLKGGKYSITDPEGFDRAFSELINQEIIFDKAVSLAQIEYHFMLSQKRALLLKPSQLALLLETVLIP